MVLTLRTRWATGGVATDGSMPAPGSPAHTGHGARTTSRHPTAAAWLPDVYFMTVPPYELTCRRKLRPGEPIRGRGSLQGVPPPSSCWNFLCVRPGAAVSTHLSPYPSPSIPRCAMLSPRRNRLAGLFAAFVLLSALGCSSSAPAPPAAVSPT